MARKKSKPSPRKRAVCLTEGCNRKPWVRGVCQRCIHNAYEMIRRGEKTMGELEREGAVLKRRGKVSKFRKSLLGK